MIHRNLVICVNLGLFAGLNHAVKLLREKVLEQLSYFHSSGQGGRFPADFW